MSNLVKIKLSWKRRLAILLGKPIILEFAEPMESFASIDGVYIRPKQYAKEDLNEQGGKE